jgi:hypothetical protein
LNEGAVAPETVVIDLVIMSEIEVSGVIAFLFNLEEAAVKPRILYVITTALGHEIHLKIRVSTWMLQNNLIPSRTTTLFGPWMDAERHERRYNSPSTMIKSTRNDAKVYASY